MPVKLSQPLALPDEIILRLCRRRFTSSFLNAPLTPFVVVQVGAGHFDIRVTDVRSLQIIDEHMLILRPWHGLSSSGIIARFRRYPR